MPRAHPGLDNYVHRHRWAPEGWGGRLQDNSICVAPSCSETSEIKSVIDSTVRSEDLALGYEAHQTNNTCDSRQVFFFS